MSQDIRLYSSTQVWDQPMQAGQRNLLQAIRDFWPEGIDSALDVGCGDGKLTSQLMDLGTATIVGLDSSEEALSRLPLQGVKGDAQQLPFADGAFDLVMSTDALEHMPDAEENAAWNELFRVAGKAVMVAVPFREELLDATARCKECGHCYHVNWHQRSYDYADLHRRAPAGWRISSTVLAGEPWSAMLPPETHLRRLALDEWSGWDAAICPECSSSGRCAQELQTLPPVLAEALGERLYEALGEQRLCRSHSEILVLFQRQDIAQSAQSAVIAEHREQAATCLDLQHQRPGADLQPYCQVAQHVLAADGCWRLQFPLYEPTPLLQVSRVPGSQGPLHLQLEDACGLLFDGRVLEDGQEHSQHSLPRRPVPGYYGVLASCSVQEPFASIRLGQGPGVIWAQAPDGEEYAYFQSEDSGRPLFVQITKPTWLDLEALKQAQPAVKPPPAQVLSHIQQHIDRALERGNQNRADTTAEMNQLLVQIQNLTAERDALMLLTQEADLVAVKNQNLTAERDALLIRAQEADLLAIQNQNLSAEHEALLIRSEDAKQLAVQIQNLTAERDALLIRSEEAERHAVHIQNLTAERNALLIRSEEVDRLEVEIQNLAAERDALLVRAKEADRLAVQIQNLSAERDVWQMRGSEANRLAVQIQNLEAERNALQIRNEDVDRLAVQIQNLTVERDALLKRAEEANRLAVHIQNLAAEREALLAQINNDEHLRNIEIVSLKKSIGTLETQCQHLKIRSQETENMLSQAQESMTRLEDDNTQLRSELEACQLQLTQLSQHFENRLGATTRRALASLAGKK
ncbi:methyltransferase domain-containing protein [Pseudomonas danubii]|uniref:methyltransferase domain-containing protein n=1 Tax=Pseudomonas danubii TaxID=2497146 RepID=UPI003857EAB0